MVASALALAGTGFVARPAHAQSSAADRRAAADAYDNGTRRFLQRDFPGAANWFETADRLAPSALAMRSAIRAHREVGTPTSLARAATMALRLRERYPNDAESMTAAQRAIEQLQGQLGRVTVRCTGCEVEVDQAVQSGLDFFVVPGRHTILAHLSGGRNREQTVDAQAGRTSEVALETSASGTGTATAGVGGTTSLGLAGSGAGAGSAGLLPTGSMTGSGTNARTASAGAGGSAGSTDPGAAGSSGAGASGGDAQVDRPPSGGFTPIPFIAGSALTAAGIVVSAISYVDARAQGDALIQHAGMPSYPYAQLMRDQASTEGAETRTTALVIGTSVVGAASVAMFVLWRVVGRSAPPPAAATAYFDGRTVGVGGHF